MVPWLRSGKSRPPTAALGGGSVPTEARSAAVLFCDSVGSLAFLLQWDPLILKLHSLCAILAERTESVFVVASPPQGQDL